MTGGASPDFSPTAGILSGPSCFQAPTGRSNLAQVNGLGIQDQPLGQALKGRANPSSHFSPDLRFIMPTGRAERWIRGSPFQGSAAQPSVNPGRCPGLDWVAPLGLAQIRRNGMAATAVAHLWLRVCRAVYT